MLPHDVPESSALHKYVLQEAADDLIHEWGHSDDAMKKSWMDSRLFQNW